MIYQLFDIVDRSFLLICLYFAPLGPFAVGAAATGLAAAALLIGGFTQFFLLRKRKMVWMIPISCVAAEVVFEILFQTGAKAMAYDGFWDFIVLGVLLLYVLLGTLLGWLVYRKRNMAAA